MSEGLEKELAVLEEWQLEVDVCGSYIACFFSTTHHFSDVTAIVGHPAKVGKSWSMSLTFKNITFHNSSIRSLIKDAHK